MRIEDVHDADCFIIAVAPNEFKELGLTELMLFLLLLCRYREGSHRCKRDIFCSTLEHSSGVKWWRLYNNIGHSRKVRF